MYHKQLGRGPGVSGAGGIAAAGVPKGHHGEVSPKEDNPAPHLQPEPGQPTKSLKCRQGERSSVLHVRARKGPKPPIQPLQGTKRKSVCDTEVLISGGLTSRTISADEQLFTMSVVSVELELLAGMQPQPHLVVLLLGTRVQMHDVLHQLLMEPEHSEHVPSPKSQLAWSAAPAGATPGHGVTVNTGPSVPHGATTCAAPSLGQTFQRGFLWALALLGMDSGHKVHFALNQKQICQNPAVGQDTSEPGGSRGERDLALMVTETCNKAFAVHHQSTTFKPILSPLAPCHYT